MARTLLRCSRARIAIHPSMFFFFNDPATPEIYPLPLHDALPIYPRHCGGDAAAETLQHRRTLVDQCAPDRKSTRLNSSHDQTSYAVFCLQKNHTHALCMPYILPLMYRMSSDWG